MFKIITKLRERSERRKFGDKDYELIKAARAQARASRVFVGLVLVQLFFGLFMLGIAAVILVGVH